MPSIVKLACPACRAAVSSEDRFCGECGAELPADTQEPIAVERGEVRSEQDRPSADAPIALAAAVRLQRPPEAKETPGTLLAENETLCFFSQDPAATLSLPLSRCRELFMTPIGPVDVLRFRCDGREHAFLLKGGADFYEALSEMLVQKPDAAPTLRLRALSETFSTRAADIVGERFSIAGLLGNVDAARSFMRLIELITRE